MSKPEDMPKVTQAMINAYDEYTHLSLDRRGFMEKLTLLAGSGAVVPAAGVATLWPIARRAAKKRAVT